MFFCAQEAFSPEKLANTDHFTRILVRKGYYQCFFCAEEALSPRNLLTQTILRGDSRERGINNFFMYRGSIISEKFAKTDNFTKRLTTKGYDWHTYKWNLYLICKWQNAPQKNFFVGGSMKKDNLMHFFNIHD